MKLRHNEKFGQRAGSAWRLIFVYALMPWLHNHRIRWRMDLSEYAPGSKSLRFASLRNAFEQQSTASGDELGPPSSLIGGGLRGRPNPVLEQEKIEELEKQNLNLNVTNTELAESVDDLQEEVERLRSYISEKGLEPLEEKTFARVASSGLEALPAREFD